MTNILNCSSFYVFSGIKLPGFSKQTAANRSSKAKDEEKEAEVTIKQSEGQKAVPETSKGEKVEVKNSLGGGEGGGKPIPGGRQSTRNSVEAAMNKIKADNIQLGTHAPTVSCQCLVVSTGGPVSQEIYKSDDESVHKSDSVSNTVSDGQSPASTDVHQERCMVPQYSSPYPYRQPQTARRGRVKMPMTRLNTPHELGKFKTDVTPAE